MLPADPEWFATGALPWQSGRLTSPGISRCQGITDPASEDDGGFPPRRSDGGLDGRGGDTGGPGAGPGRLS